MMNANTRPIDWSDMPLVTAFLDSLTSRVKSTLTADQGRAKESLAIAAYEAAGLGLYQD